MLGLTAIEHTINPQTTLDKFLFLVEYGFTHFHKQTALTSLAALLALIFLRSAKQLVKKWPILYRMPEVLVVVILSTS